MEIETKFVDLLQKSKKWSSDKIKEWFTNENNIYIGDKILFNEVQIQRSPFFCPFSPIDMGFNRLPNKSYMHKNYRNHIVKKLRTDSKLYEDFLKLKGKNLGCFCGYGEFVCHYKVLEDLLENGLKTTEEADEDYKKEKKRVEEEQLKREEKEKEERIRKYKEEEEKFIKEGKEQGKKIAKSTTLLEIGDITISEDCNYFIHCTSFVDRLEDRNLMNEYFKIKPESELLFIESEYLRENYGHNPEEIKVIKQILEKSNIDILSGACFRGNTDCAITFYDTVRYCGLSSLVWVKYITCGSVVIGIFKYDAESG